MITYMLDTCICSFIMREHPEAVLLRLSYETSQNNRIAHFRHYHVERLKFEDWVA